MPADLNTAPQGRKRKPKFSDTRQLFARLRAALASAAASLPDIADLVARELKSDASVIYVARAGEVLELAATYGLNIGAVGTDAACGSAKALSAWLRPPAMR